MTISELPLSAVLSFHNGKKPPELADDGYPVFGSNGRIGSAKTYNHENAVILGRVGAYCGSVEFCEGKFWASDNTIVVKPLDGFDAKYLYYNLKNQPLRSFAGGAAQPLITHGILRPIRAIYHRSAEQNRIAAILSAYDDLIENNRRRITMLEETARQLYREWFVRFRFPGHEHVELIDGWPVGWKRTSASAVIDVLSGGTPKTTTAQFWDGEIGFFTPKDATPGFYVSTTEKTITEEGLSKCNSRLYAKDTLFITARGTVGKMNLALVPMAMNQSCYALVSNAGMSQRLLYLTMEASLQQFRSQASGAVFDAIVVATFDRIVVTKPDAGIAQAFDELVNPIFDQVANLGKQNEQLSKARDLLLPKLMSGAITI